MPIFLVFFFFFFNSNSTKFNNNVPLVYNVNMVATARGF